MTRRIVGVLLLLIAARAHALVKGDFTEDGWPDIPFGDSSGTWGSTRLLVMGGMIVHFETFLPALPAGYFIQAVSDFDGDGKNDIVVRNAGGRVPATNDYEVALWIMNGTSLGQIIDLPSLLHGANIAGAGDFDGDGKADLVIKNGAGPNALWLLNGTTFSSIVDLPAIPDVNWGIVGVGDFNGDAMPDILWENYVSGAMAIWVMNRTTVASIVDLPAIPRGNDRYDAVGVADFNGDGKPDILFQNRQRSPSALAIWVMNGTSFASVADVPPSTVPQTWSVMGPK